MVNGTTTVYIYIWKNTVLTIVVNAFYSQGTLFIELHITLPSKEVIPNDMMKEIGLMNEWMNKRKSHKMTICILFLVILFFQLVYLQRVQILLSTSSLIFPLLQKGPQLMKKSFNLKNSPKLNCSVLKEHTPTKQV